MPRPLKVSEKGVPLTCAEHDENINRLLDRSNHTGTQSASTIHDLPIFLSNSSTVSGLTTQLANLTSLVESLQEDVLAPGGHVDSLISQLEAAYTSADTAINNRLNSSDSRLTSLETGHSNQQGLIDNLNQRVNTLTTANQANTQAIQDLDNQVDSRFAPLETGHSNQQSLIDNLNQRVNNLTTANQANNQAIQDLDNQVDTLSSLLGGTNVSGLLGDLNAIKQVIQPVIDGDSFIVPTPPNNNDGLIFGWDTTTSTPIWRFPDNIRGGNLIDPIGTTRLNLSSNP